MSDRTEPRHTTLLRVSLTNGVAQISLPDQITAHDLKKLRKLLEVVALDVDEGKPAALVAALEQGEA